MSDENTRRTRVTATENVDLNTGLKCEVVMCGKEKIKMRRLI